MCVCVSLFDSFALEQIVRHLYIISCLIFICVSFDEYRNLTYLYTESLIYYSFYTCYI